MKKKYLEPETEVIRYKAEDIIMTSDPEEEEST